MDTAHSQHRPTLFAAVFTMETREEYLFLSNQIPVFLHETVTCRLVSPNNICLPHFLPVNKGLIIRMYRSTHQNIASFLLELGGTNTHLYCQFQNWNPTQTIHSPLQHYSYLHDHDFIPPPPPSPLYKRKSIVEAGFTHDIYMMSLLVWITFTAYISQLLKTTYKPVLVNIIGFDRGEEICVAFSLLVLAHGENICTLYRVQILKLQTELSVPPCLVIFN